MKKNQKKSPEKSGLSSFMQLFLLTPLSVFLKFHPTVGHLLSSQPQFFE
jgi:hypothetical protein